MGLRLLLTRLLNSSSTGLLRGRPVVTVCCRMWGVGSVVLLCDILQLVRRRVLVRRVGVLSVLMRIVCVWVDCHRRLLVGMRSSRRVMVVGR